MSLSVTVTPGYQFNPAEEVTNTKLNLAATPTVNLAGAAGSASIADGAVTNVKLADASVSTAKLIDANVTLAKLADDAKAGTQVAPVATTKNLTIAVGAGALATHQVVIAADEMVLGNATGVKFLATAVSLSADILVSALNGLDTGSVAPSTWYYVWVVYDPVGLTVGALLSKQTTLAALTLPGTYSYGAMVGAVPTDGSSHFISFRQLGREVFYAVEQYIFQGAAGQNGLGPLSAGAQLTAWAAVVPPVAKVVFGDFGIQSNGIALHAQVTTSTSNLAGRVYISAGSSATLYSGMYASGSFRLPLLNGTAIFWDTGTGSNTYRLMVTGFALGFIAT